ncbi:MAG: acyltransferase family protein [Oscillospiraceae bacterium]|nr:acyltransferase family protein [Oscillospiraceae bacterium]
METTATIRNIAEEQTTTQKRRLDYIDIAKGMLILAVVFSHAWFANSDILGDFIPFSMPAFFFLSGYTYKTGRGYLKNIGKRALGLLVPYVLFGAFCTLLYPAYVTLSKVPAWQQMGAKAIWLAVAKTDAINMLMATPMWFLMALFTASIIFFALADKLRGSLKWTVIVSAVLVATALAIDVLKKQNLWWFVDFAPYGAAMMFIGSYCGEKKLFSRLSAKTVVIGLVCLAAAEALNRLFPGSGKTSIVQYIDPKKWYGVLTAFCIAVTGSVGTLCVARLVQQVPVLRSVFKWLGRNSLWILCIHYTAIMLIELALYNAGALTNSIMDIVAQQIYGYGNASDTALDIVLKVTVAIASIGISAIYALIHNKVKRAIKSRRAAV